MIIDCHHNVGADFISVCTANFSTSDTQVRTNTQLDRGPAEHHKKIRPERSRASEDCAGASVFLRSPAASYITGHILTVEGGLTVGQIGKM